MGWGAKKAAAPRPEGTTHERPAPVASPIATVARSRTPREHEALDEGEGTGDSLDSTDHVRPDFKHELAWGKLKSQKGWTGDTVAMLLYEFIKERGLFGDLVKHVRRRA